MKLKNRIYNLSKVSVIVFFLPSPTSKTDSRLKTQQKQLNSKRQSDS